MGRVTELIYGGQYVAIRRSLLSKLVVPIRSIESSGDRLVLPYTSSYLDSAPKVDPKQPLSEDDRSRLDRFYMPQAA